jgi:hypothetical protein
MWLSSLSIYRLPKYELANQRSGSEEAEWHHHFKPTLKPSNRAQNSVSTHISSKWSYVAL